jgi:hypothetical protein
MKRSEIRGVSQHDASRIALRSIRATNDELFGGIPMKRALLIAGLSLALCGATSAQAPKGPATPASSRLPAGWTAAPAAATLVRVPFGCDARAPNTCFFRIFYTRGDRIVILAAGLKEKKVPASIGGEYCMTLNKAPPYKCTRKVINGTYNS